MGTVYIMFVDSLENKFLLCRCCVTILQEYNTFRILKLCQVEEFSKVKRDLGKNLIKTDVSKVC